MPNSADEEGAERGCAIARRVTANFERAMHDRMTNTMTSVRIPRYLLQYARMAHVNMSAILADALRRRWLKKHDRCESKNRIEPDV
jgi:post-segregation antitoxin (ccd killing protein)